MPLRATIVPNRAKEFATYYPGDLPLPYTYLTADGKLSLEWDLDTKDVAVEVDIKKRKGEWYIYNKDTANIEDEVQLNLAVSDGWSSMVEHLRSLAK